MELIDPPINIIEPPVQIILSAMRNALAIQMSQALSEMWNDMTAPKDVIRVNKPERVWFGHRREANAI